jgi:alpha-glucosidase
MFGKIVNFEIKDNNINIVFENNYGTISIINDAIINVFSKLDDVKPNSKAIENPVKSQTEVTAVLDGDCIVISTAELIVKVYDEFLVDFYQKDGLLLCKDYRGERTINRLLSQKDMELMALEGHQLIKDMQNHKIQVMKVLEGDECFYGLGDRTGFLNKRNYAYELWNTDEPAPQVDSFKILYKAIPFIISLKSNCTYGIFFDNTYRSYWDLGKESADYYFFGADNGNLNYYFIAGDKVSDIVAGYTSLTGTVPRPQLWTLGYQQSRWGYETEEYVRELAAKMREHRIPCDVIHLDIDYMDNYKVFTWNKESYDNPKRMIQDLSQDGFKFVTIIDPGVKAQKGYDVYDEGIKNDYFAKTEDNQVYINQVWPGDSVYPDFGKKRVRDWWSDKQKYLVDMGVRGVWNDMNEPASFKGEIPDDVIFSDEERKATHGEMHNVYGHLMSKAAYKGWKKHDNRRPFVITRACYAGSQKYTTAWTGDNHSIWAHLQMAIPQLCNLGLSGMSFVGTDVGGFGSDTTPELLARWVQVGCFSPLFRNHSNKGTVKQEPWQFDKKTLDIYRKYVELRYQLLPYFYDLFVSQEETGLPILRPLVLHYEKDEKVHELNDEFLVGENILVAPVVMQGALNRLVYLPEGLWIDYWTKEQQVGPVYLIKEAVLDVCPMYVKAGTILPKYPVQDYVGEKEITELILDSYPGNGEYIHVQDDGETFAYEDGVYNQYKFSIDENRVFRVELLHKGYEKVYESFYILCGEKTVQIPFQGEEIETKLEW